MKKNQIVRKTYEKILNCYFNIKILGIILPSHFLFVSLHLVEVDLVCSPTWKGNYSTLKKVQIYFCHSKRNLYLCNEFDKKRLIHKKQETLGSEDIRCSAVSGSLTSTLNSISYTSRAET